MSNPYFHFKQFTVYHDQCAMKVTTDGCLFGAWVAQALSREAKAGERMLDIGTGTGLLSMMVAQQAPVSIDAVEIEKAAAGQAGANIDSSPWKENIRVHQEDILTFGINAPYDYIISNPPFYENDLTSAREEKNRAHHHSSLLFDQLFPLISTHLKEEGKAFLLLPYRRKEEVYRQLEKNGLHLHEEVIVRTTAAAQPFRLMIAVSKFSQATVPSVIIIRDENNVYTEAFTALLSPYYLYLP